MPPLHDEWKKLLKPEFEKAYFNEIFNFLEKEKASGKTVYPNHEEIFAAFNHATPAKLKLVIIGQDPYHGPKQAHGLCFSVRKGIPAPPSLKNIYKELRNDLGIREASHGDLTSWADQGILLLNAILTVRANEAGSHQHIGWQKFTDAVIEIISSRFEAVIFLLWGKFAHSKEKLIDLSRHFVLKSAHPSPFSATYGFFGNKHFSKSNEILKSIGKEAINWKLD